MYDLLPVCLLGSGCPYCCPCVVEMSCVMASSSLVCLPRFAVSFRVAACVWNAPLSETSFPALGQSLTIFAETPKSLTPTFLGVVLTAFSEPSARQDWDALLTDFLDVDILHSILRSISSSFLTSSKILKKKQICFSLWRARRPHPWKAVFLESWQCFQLLGFCVWYLWSKVLSLMFWLPFQSRPIGHHFLPTPVVG